MNRRSFLASAAVAPAVTATTANDEPPSVALDMAKRGIEHVRASLDLIRAVQRHRDDLTVGEVMVELDEIDRVLTTAFTACTHVRFYENVVKTDRRAVVSQFENGA